MPRRYLRGKGERCETATRGQEACRETGGSSDTSSAAVVDPVVCCGCAIRRGARHIGIGRDEHRRGVCLGGRGQPGHQHHSGHKGARGYQLERLRHHPAVRPGKGLRGERRSRVRVVVDARPADQQRSGDSAGHRGAVRHRPDYLPRLLDHLAGGLSRD